MASVAVNARAIPLAVAAPYLAAYLEPRVDGLLGAQVNLDWKAAGEHPAADKAADKAAKARSTDAPGALHVGVKTLTLHDVALAEPQSARPAPPARPARPARPAKAAKSAKSAKPAKPAKPVAKAGAARPSGTADAAALPSARRIEVTDAQVDLARQTVSVDKLSVTDPHAGVQRGADKQWMFERWLRTAASPPATEKSAATQKSERNHPNTKAAPWQVAIKEVAMDGGEVAYRDEAAARPVAFQVSALKLELKNFVLGGSKPMPLAVSARVGAGRVEPGRLDYHGEVGLAPLSAQGQVQAVRLPLQAFAPYVDDRLNVELVRADGSFRGRVQYRDEKAGPRVQLNGDAALEDLRANSLPESAGSTSGATPAAAATATTTAAAPAQSRGPGGGATGPVGSQLLRWKALSVRGLSVAMQPGAPVHV